MQQLVGEARGHEGVDHSGVDRVEADRHMMDHRPGRRPGRKAVLGVEDAANHQQLAARAPLHPDAPEPAGDVGHRPPA
jgi:hypothetical protein